LSIDDEMLKRAVNVGFSGGEKKRYEILQMALLEPSWRCWMKPIPGLMLTR
jgi:Fe-S cluster assembly ATP-binding protein